MSIYKFDSEQPISPDEHFMQEALKEARKAFDADEVPVGAVIVCKNRIIARGYNLTERLNDVTAHAEMQAFTAAASYLGGKYLTDCTLYVTLEPCVMCAGAVSLARIDRVVFGAFDPRKGGVGSLYNILRDDRLNHMVEISSGVLEKECSQILSVFFEEVRQTKAVDNGGID